MSQHMSLDWFAGLQPPHVRQETHQPSALQSVGITCEHSYCGNIQNPPTLGPSLSVTELLFRALSPQ